VVQSASKSCCLCSRVFDDLLWSRIGFGGSFKYAGGDGWQKVRGTPVTEWGVKSKQQCDALSITEQLNKDSILDIDRWTVCVLNSLRFWSDSSSSIMLPGQGNISVTIDSTVETGTMESCIKTPPLDQISSNNVLDSCKGQINRCLIQDVKKSRWCCEICQYKMQKKHTRVDTQLLQPWTMWGLNPRWGTHYFGDFKTLRRRLSTRMAYTSHIFYKVSDNYFRLLTNRPSTAFFNSQIQFL